ncbi:MAG: prolyl oligopeptidase family serine peptidase [Chloroflexi bacterium]|nr:prolyl oligopeptidase family serine peptidase [Chloroflexota bacterium]
MTETPTSVTTERTLRQRLLFVLRGGLFAIVILLLGLPTLLGFGLMLGLTAPGCSGGGNPARLGLPFESIRFHSADLDRMVDGYFLPGAAPADGAAVIVVPTGSRERGDRLGEIAVYQRAGYHVLSYDGRPCAGQTINSLGYRESALVADALDYLATRPEVDATRVGVHGFSAGGAAAVMAAARYPQVAAVVAQGGYHDFSASLDETTAPQGWFGGLFRFGMDAAYRLSTGMDMNNLKPIAVIDTIAPRPILLVYGTNEPALDGGRLQAQAGGPNTALWEVPGAGHGNYLAVAPDAYPQRLITFMDAALRPN